jgi:hypothetical protein
MSLARGKSRKKEQRRGAEPIRPSKFSKLAWFFLNLEQQ